MSIRFLAGPAIPQPPHSSSPEYGPTLIDPKSGGLLRSKEPSSFPAAQSSETLPVVPAAIDQTPVAPAATGADVITRPIPVFETVTLGDMAASRRAVDTAGSTRHMVATSGTMPVNEAVLLQRHEEPADASAKNADTGAVGAEDPYGVDRRHRLLKRIAGAKMKAALDEATARNPSGNTDARFGAEAVQAVPKDLAARRARFAARYASFNRNAASDTTDPSDRQVS